MSWRDQTAAFGRLFRPVIALAIAGSVAACFQPMYADRSASGGPDVVAKLGAIDVKPIDAAKGSPEARIGGELRNALIFDLTGGGGGGPTQYRLDVRITTSRSATIVDITTARTDFEVTGIDATYVLVDSRTGKPALTGRAFARVTSDAPGQQQRFARARAQRDAENRAAKVVADQIRSRLAAFVVSGT